MATRKAMLNVRRSAEGLNDHPSDSTEHPTSKLLGRKFERTVRRRDWGSTRFTPENHATCKSVQSFVLKSGILMRNFARGRRLRSKTKTETATHESVPLLSMPSLLADTRLVAFLTERNASIWPLMGMTRLQD